MRRPFPWFSTTRSGGGWFCKLAGEQHLLGKHPHGMPSPKYQNGRWHPPEVILNEFYRKMSVADPTSQADYDLEAICALYLEELDEKKPLLQKRYAPILGQFCDFVYRGKMVGKLLVNAQLDVNHLEAWAGTLHTDGTRRTYISCIKRCLDWAVSRKCINVTRNPVQGVATPKIESRAVVIEKAEHLGLLDLWHDDQSICDLLKAMWATGARPGELSKVEKHHYKDGFWKLDPIEHKTGYLTGKDRVIGVVGDLSKIVDRLCERYPTGPLFRNTYGRRWTVQALFIRFERARRLKVIRDEVVPYAYRHAWATHALESGNLTEYEVAKALGHRTTQMVLLHYDHSRRNHAHLRDIFERAGR